MVADAFAGQATDQLKPEIDRVIAAIEDPALLALKPSWEVGVDYRMAGQGTRWMISDLLVERTSLVRNFRSQFDSVIKRSSYEELVKKVRARLP